MSTIRKRYFTLYRLDADKLGQLGPSLGMKKSSSLESLQTMVQEVNTSPISSHSTLVYFQFLQIQMQEEGNPAYGYRTTSGPKIIRGRGCEESFRAAVDNKHLDPNHRSEISAKKHWLLDPPTEGDGFNNVRGGVRQSSLNAALDRKNKAGKKKPGLLKGIGSMFRFGKHRKMEFGAAEVQHYQQTEESEPQEGDPTTIPNEQHEQQQQQQREPIYQRHHGYVHRHAEQVQVIPENSVPTPVRYRGGHLSGEQRRSDRQSKSHSHKMQHRHSHYPSDDRDTLYEQITRQVRYFRFW